MLMLLGRTPPARFLLDQESEVDARLLARAVRKGVRIDWTKAEEEAVQLLRSAEIQAVFDEQTSPMLASHDLQRLRIRHWKVSQLDKSYSTSERIVGHQPSPPPQYYTEVVQACYR